jgi:pimeloyl-ACP methyl ester carboxylesterase
MRSSIAAAEAHRARQLFGAEEAAAIHRPVLSVVGAETQPLWVEIADFLRASLPYVEESTIAGTGHLLQIQRPELVAREIAQFLGRNPLGGDRAEHVNQNTA